MNAKVPLILSRESQTEYNSPLPKITLVTHQQYLVYHLVTVCAWLSVGWTCCFKFYFTVLPLSYSWDMLSAAHWLKEVFSYKVMDSALLAVSASGFDLLGGWGLEWGNG